MAKSTDVRPKSLARIKTEAQAKKYIDAQIKEIQAQVGEGKVLLALSGGVDSSVCAALISKAIGNQLTCVHVNHGLLRKGEPEMVCKVFSKQFKANLVYVDASNKFLKALKGVADPEEKRKIIGGMFIEVFAKEAKKIKGVGFLGQGTIYPDILESKGGIKAHHNVGGLPEDMQKFELVEPVKFLYKDEVRVVGKALGLPENMVNRQPFPGPGLGVRCVGAITKERLEAVRESDAILREEFKKAGLEGKVWQYFTIVPDFKTTGMCEGKRTDNWPVVIRAINSVDATSAKPVELSFKLIEKLTKRILKEVPGVSRVLVDYSFKDPKLNSATIEWE